MKVLFLVAALVVCCAAKPSPALQTLMKRILAQVENPIAKRMEGDELLVFAASSTFANLHQKCEAFCVLTGNTIESLTANWDQANQDDDAHILEQVCPGLAKVGNILKDMDRLEAANIMRPVLEEGMCVSILANLEGLQYLADNGMYDMSARDADYVKLENEVLAKCEAEFGKDEAGDLLNRLGITVE